MNMIIQKKETKRKNSKYIVPVELWVQGFGPRRAVLSHMPKSPVKLTARGEVLQIKSPAEFFAENQNIAGFDNVCISKFVNSLLQFMPAQQPGKCLYTTIRELVENSLDVRSSL